MLLSFRRVELPPTVDALAPHEKAQLLIAGESHDGEQRSIEARLREGQGAGEGSVERWRVGGDDVARYEIWILGGDSGAVFFANESRLVGHIVQFGFTAPKHREDWRALDDAARSAAEHDGPYPSGIDFSMEAPASS